MYPFVWSSPKNRSYCKIQSYCWICTCVRHIQRMVHTYGTTLMTCVIQNVTSTASKSQKASLPIILAPIMHKNCIRGITASPLKSYDWRIQPTQTTDYAILPTQRNSTFWRTWLHETLHLRLQGTLLPFDCWLKFTDPFGRSIAGVVTSQRMTAEIR